MLYIFHVDTGTMLTFDMNLAMDSVSNLQRVIAKACRIQEDKQVLLISGGESLDPASRVGSYSAGTDTNPIFLFSKSTIEAATPPSPSVHYGSDIDLQEQVEGSLIMPPTYETVVSRAQLALQFHEVDKEELRACEKLVHDQHLQQQGWAAVVANLEDITSALKRRSDVFQDSYVEYLGVRDHFISLLTKIPDVLSLLSKIPVLRCLQCVTTQAVPEETESGEDLAPQTLYAWINSQDPTNRLEDLSTQCLKVTEQFDDHISEMLKGEVLQTFEAVTNQNMKEVKGLEDRLYGLDQIMSGAKRLVQEQGEMSQGFVQNQNRAGNLKDNSVLPDLCASHKKQLLVMLSNHRKLREIKKKCRMAKEELSVNLHTRLRWVMFVEKKLCDVDGKLMIYHENLKRLRKRLNILQQIHDAPYVYAQLVVEVVRRKNFSTNFLQWACNLAEESSLLHSDEVKRREVFLVEVGQHFLQALFHGFEDVPPTFATDSPDQFDHHLPNITPGDLDVLQQAVPELSEKFCLSKDNSMDLEQRLSALGPKACASHLSLPDSISPGRNGSKSHQLTPLCQSHNTCTSDIDILQESNGHFSPIECEEISFDGHICAPGTETVLKPQLHSPHENLVFLMPESLSTKLTAEMKSQASIEKVHLSDSTNVQTLSGSTTADKSSDDSTSSRKIVLGGTVTTDTSPEGEDFTTADFYIDESLPSSIEHMTASKSLEKSELSKQLQEKSENVTKLEEELKGSQNRLCSSVTKMKTLQDLVQTELEKFKSDLVDVKDHYCKEKNVFLENLENFSKNFSQVLKNYEIHINESHSKELNAVQILMDERTSDLERQIVALQQRTEKLQSELQDTKEQWDTTKADSEAIRISLQTKINELSEAYEKEREEIIRGHALEMEVELDRVQDNFQQEINKKEENLTEKSHEIVLLQGLNNKLKLEKNELFEQLTQKFQQEKDELVSTLKKEFEQKQETAVIDALEERNQIHEDALLKLKLEFDEKVIEIENSITKSKEEEYESSVKILKEEFAIEKTFEIEQIRNSLLKDHEENLKKTEQEYSANYEKKLNDKLTELVAEKDAMKIEIEKLTKEAVTESKTELEIVTREKHEQIVMDIQANFEQMKFLAVDEALKQCKAEHEKELSSLGSSTEREDTEKLTALRASAEKQVVFNEAVSKLTTEKEKLIEELRARETTLLSQQEKDKELLEELVSEKTTAQSELQTAQEKLHSMRSKQRQLEDDLAMSRQQLENYRHQIQSMSSVSIMSSASEMSGLPLDESMMRSNRLLELEGTIKTKEDDIQKLSQKVMELSMTASTRNLTQDKVSITSCSIGDIVLLCLDERHDQYVVFTIGTTLHFLHSDCLQALGLKTDAGEARKSWVLAQILEKEYCQAKKPQNRFRVPVGTKFYRVKAKPWSRESPRKTANQGAVGGAMF